MSLLPPHGLLRALGLMAASIAAYLPPFGAVRADEPCSAVFEVPAAAPGEPVNLGRMKAQLEVYHGCQYGRAIEKVLAEAEAYVEARAPAVGKPAIVLDIDETSLSGWPMLLHNDLGLIKNGDCTMQPQTACGFTAWKLRAQAKVIAPTLALFKAALERDVQVFFISGRFEGAKMRAATVANLRAAGYTGWRELILRTPKPGCGVTCYKRQARAAIAAQGYTIIANVGDQWSDLDPAPDGTSGSYAERIFKVPNPFYFIP